MKRTVDGLRGKMYNCVKGEKQLLVDARIRNLKSSEKKEDRVHSSQQELKVNQTMNIYFLLIIAKD